MCSFAAYFFLQSLYTLQLQPLHCACAQRRNFSNKASSSISPVHLQEGFITRLINPQFLALYSPSAQSSPGAAQAPPLLFTYSVLFLGSCYYRLVTPPLHSPEPLHSFVSAMENASEKLMKREAPSKGRRVHLEALQGARGGRGPRRILG